MTFSRINFDNQVWKIVSGIKPGRIMSYGEVARAAGFPRHARMVSKSLCRSPKPLPWHRVIKSDLTLAFPPGSANYKKQKSLLKAEGAQFQSGKVVPSKTNINVNLDKLLWGPAKPDHSMGGTAKAKNAKVGG